MKETQKSAQAANVGSEGVLKPYQRPKLTPLGTIHSLVHSMTGTGADGPNNPGNNGTS